MRTSNPHHFLRLRASLGPRADSSGDWRDASILAALALGINLFGIGTRSLIFDEATSVLYARMSLRSLLSVVTVGDPNQSLYYFLLHFWVRIAGETETAVRSLSALFGALAVAAVYLVGTRLFGRLPGLFSGLLLAVNAFFVQYAQTARSYSLLLFLTTLSSYFFVVELEEPSLRTRTGYVLASVLAFYVHYFALYMLLVHALALLAIDRRNALSHKWLTIGGTMLLLALPAVAVASIKGPGQMSWINPPSAHDVWEVLVDLAGGSVPVLLLTATAGAGALAVAWQQRRFWPYGFVVAWAVVPIALALAVSFAQPMFIPYYLISSVAGLVLSAAAAVRLCRPVVAAAFAALILAFSIPKLATFDPPARSENWRDATPYILARVRPGDGLAFYPSSAIKPFEYYERRQGVSQTASVSRPHRPDDKRVWFLVRDSDASNRPAEITSARARLTERYRLVDRTVFRRLTVELYER